MLDAKVSPIRRKRTVPFKEFEPLLYKAKNRVGGGDAGVGVAIGVSVNTIWQWRTKNEVPEYAIMAMRGLLLERASGEEASAKAFDVNPFEPDELKKIMVWAAKCGDTGLVVKVAKLVEAGEK